jgi:hypothetical protein
MGVETVAAALISPVTSTSRALEQASIVRGSKQTKPSIVDFMFVPPWDVVVATHASKRARAARASVERAARCCTLRLEEARATEVESLASSP